jgi:hypothetical protein
MAAARKDAWAEVHKHGLKNLAELKAWKAKQSSTGKDGTVAQVCWQTLVVEKIEFYSSLEDITLNSLKSLNLNDLQCRVARTGVSAPHDHLQDENRATNCSSLPHW